MKVVCLVKIEDFLESFLDENKLFPTDNID